MLLVLCIVPQIFVQMKTKQQQKPPSNYIHQNPIFKCVCMLFNINKTFSKHIVIKFIKNTLLANRFIYRKNKEGLILTINVFFKQ